MLEVIRLNLVVYFAVNHEVRTVSTYKQACTVQCLSYLWAMYYEVLSTIQKTRGFQIFESPCWFTVWLTRDNDPVPLALSNKYRAASLCPTELTPSPSVVIPVSHSTQAVSLHPSLTAQFRTENLAFHVSVRPKGNSLYPSLLLLLLRRRGGSWPMVGYRGAPEGLKSRPYLGQKYGSCCCRSTFRCIKHHSQD